ncbi:MAG: hypothetical protein F6K54_07600 [Okeania sp. SIO3B5]|uniref:hypothetical protein n=1 Tax=Okeania sp. SIO3B5 TaxID=2607811 RepID=UPI0014003D81|nr:hypothetical protein [Okeania sp. SIO3B5]NEO52953.1 hypothetical protein [Okeania sp. SIO3B5]
MSQSSLVKSTKSSTYQLNPTLQAVMDSLDVQLEAELTRYRKYRRRTEQQSQVSQQNSNKQIYKTPELISVSPVDDQTTSPLPLSEPKSLLEDSKISNTSANKNSPVEIEPPTPSELTMANRGDAEDRNGEKQTSQLGTDNSTAPDDNLESSEKLLQSLDKLKSRRQEQPTYLASLFTPLGIVSMFLFLISCTTLGYVVMNPSGLKNLGLDRFLKDASAHKDTDDTTAGNGQNREEQPLPKSPDLASQEFVDLDLNTLSNVNPKPSQFPSPTATLRPAVPPPISGSVNTAAQPTYKPGAELDNLSSTLLPQSTQSSNQQSVATAPSSPVPSPTVKNSDSSQITTPIQSENGWYYVVVDYVNEESLYNAQQIVSDAYLRETSSGMKIQMGAFWEPEKAKEFLQELRQEKLDAKYYKLPPENY